MYKYSKFAFFHMFLFIFVTFLLAMSLLSCPDTTSIFQEEYVSKDISSLVTYRLESDSGSETRVTNYSLTEGGGSRVYNITTFPYIENSDDTDLLNLSITLDEDEDALKQKGFFLVAINNSNNVAKNVEDVVEGIFSTNLSTSSPISDSSALITNNVSQETASNIDMHPYHPDYSSHKIRIPSKTSFRSALLFNQETTKEEEEEEEEEDYFNSLVEIDIDSLDVIGETEPLHSKRSFMYKSGLIGSKICKDESVDYGSMSTLYKKLSFDYKGRTFRFAFWVEDGTFPTTDAHKSALDNIITPFTKLLYTQGDTQDDTQDDELNFLYPLLYKLQGRHIWGKHPFRTLLAPSNATIHIAFGDIKDEKIAGFVHSYNLISREALSSDSKFCTDEFTSKRNNPIVYINKNFIYKPTTTGTYELPALDLFNLYRIIVHELQHIFNSYNNLIEENNGVTSLFGLHQDIFLSELFAQSASYLASYHIDKFIANNSQIVSDSSEATLNKTTLRYFSGISSLLQENLFLSPLATNNRSLYTGDSYRIAILFAAYLAQNYGNDVLQYLVQTRKGGRDAIYEAVSKTQKYLTVSPQPKNADEILLHFFTSIFVSDTIQNNTSTSPYKLIALTSTSFDVISNDSKKLIVSLVSENGNTNAFNFPTATLNGSAFKNRRDLQGINLPVNGVRVDLDLVNTWLGGRGTYIFSGYNQTPHTLQGGQHAVIYLGGKIQKQNGAVNGEGVNTHFTTDNNGKLILKTSLSKGMLANLVVVEYK